MTRDIQNIQEKAHSLRGNVYWALWFLGMAVVIAGLTLLVLNWETQVPERWGFRGLQSFFNIPVLIVGVIVTNRRPQHPIGWLLLGSGFFGALTGFGEEYATYAILTRPGSLPAGEIVAGIANWLWILSLSLGAIYTPLLFPDGRFPSPRWRVVAWPGIAWIIFGIGRFVIEPGPLANLSFATNPFGVETLGARLSWLSLNATSDIGFLVAIISGLSLIQRYRKSGGEVRLQIKWVAYAAALTPLSVVIGQLDGWLPDLLLFLVLTVLPVAFGIAILRYRLYDIDLLINRTLVYGTLTAIVLGLYLLLVGSTGLVVQTRSNIAGLLLTGLLMVAVFRPVRGFVQRGVDRVIYREGLPSPQRSFHEPEETFARPLSGIWLKAARAGWIVLAVAAFGVLVASIPGYAAKFEGQLAHATGSELPPGAHFFAAASGVASLASSLLSIGLAALLFRRKFNEPIAALLSYFLLIYGIVMSGPLEYVSAVMPGFLRFAQAIQGVFLATPMIALLLLFPTGRFVPSWTRYVMLLTIPWNYGLILLAPFDAEGINRNPTISAVVIILFISFSLTGIYSQIYRYRKASTSIERRQTRWVIYGFGLWLVYILLSTFPYVYLTSLPPEAPTPWWGPASELGWWLGLNILPVCLTIAITRHQLWDIDLVVNRTLVYGSLTASVLVLYVLTVGGMGLLFREGDSLILPLLATGLAAILFHPLRLRLQQSINRMMYGDRDDPAAVLNKLSFQLEQTGSPESALERVVETIAQTLKLPYTAVELGDSPIPVASFGIPTYPPKTFSLVYQGEPIGRMMVTGRDPDGELTSKDIQLLENIAHQAGIVAHNVRLTDDLQRSRQNLVTAREEERRRIRRDLHDGLGPQLASQTLTLDAIEKLIDRDPEQAKTLLNDLKAQSKDAITDIRRLIYDLRPPSLDDLGLVSALRQEWERILTEDMVPDGARISLIVPVPLPPLPAAVELAAYRIVQEAVINVVKHAQANTCTVRLEMQNHTLCVEICDDGRGLPKGVRPGVGLHSMRERAEELGGKIKIRGLLEGGTCVQAQLPFSSE